MAVIAIGTEDERFESALAPVRRCLCWQQAWVRLRTICRQYRRTEIKTLLERFSPFRFRSVQTFRSSGRVLFRKIQTRVKLAFTGTA